MHSSLKQVLNWPLVNTDWLKLLRFLPVISQHLLELAQESLAEDFALATLGKNFYNQENQTRQAKAFHLESLMFCKEHHTIITINIVIFIILVIIKFLFSFFFFGFHFICYTKILAFLATKIRV